MNESKQQNYEIGQIVYILSDKAEAIVPAIVVEEHVHKKLDGNSVSWKVAVGPPEKKKIVASNEISGDIYVSLDEIQRVMVTRLTSFVDDLVEKASKRTEAWYGKITKPMTSTPGVGGKIDPAYLLDTIDGRENADAYRKTAGETIQAHHRQTEHGGTTPTSTGMHENLRIQAPINTGPLTPSKIDPSDPRASLRENLRRMAEVPDDEDEGPEQANVSDEFVVTEDGKRIPVRYNISQE